MINIPTISQLYQSILTDLQSTYGTTIPTFGKNILRVIAAVQAAKLKLFYLVIGILQKNIAPDTADSESNGGTLERFGRLKLNRNPFPAQPGQYVLTVTGNLGAIIPANTIFRSNDNAVSPGIMYVLTTQHIMVALTDTITVTALTPGLVGKLAVGDGLTATAPILGVGSNALVASEAVAPLDAEDIETYRAEVVKAYQAEPQGGAAADYRLWSFDAQGVANVYPYAKPAVTNEVNLYIEEVAASSSDGKGTPTPSLLASVQSVVEFNPDTTLPLNNRGRRPINVVVNYLPITPLNIDITISGFQNLTPDIQTLIFNALQAHTNQIRPFVAAADILANKNDILDVNQIISVILLARPGSVFGSVSFKVVGNPVSSFQFLLGNIPYFSSVTYS